MSDKLRAAALMAVDALDSDDPTIQTRAALSLRAALAEPEEKLLSVHRLDQWLKASLAEQTVKESLTVAEPEQELMGYEHHEYRTYGAPGEIRIHAVLKSQYLHPDGSIGGDFQWLIDSYKTEKTTIKLIPLYAAPPRKEWIGLTDADFEKEKFVDYNFMAGASFAEVKLREKNSEHI